MGFHPPAFVSRAANAGRRQAPPVPAPDSTPRRPAQLEVFAAGTDCVQLTWVRLGPGPVTVRVAPETGAARTAVVDADGGPGALVIDDLPSGTAVTIEVSGSGVPSPTRLATRTLPRPAGAELTRIATVSDAHLGSNSTGFFHTLIEIPPPAVDNTERALRAAIAEAVGWGARALVCKGDLVDASTPEYWAIAERCVRACPVPFHSLPGNHEYAPWGTHDPDDSAAQRGIDLVDGVGIVDVDALRLVLVDDGTGGTERGRIGHLTAEVVAAAGAAPSQGGALVLTHHQLQRFRAPTYIPPGLPGPEGRALCAALAADAPRTMVSSGHTHRHRRRTVDGITVSEVGSTRDFPGTWAGYQLFEGGLVQTVFRIAEPSVIRWTDYTRRSALGLWPRWAAGALDDRCFTVEW